MTLIKILSSLKAIVCHNEIYLLAVSLVISVDSANSCLSDQKTSEIPPDHKSWEKKKPWVFGHKGNPKEYQENTIEGFQSLVGLQADGLETDTFLTNDGQLVLFHDDNAKVKTLATCPFSNCLIAFFDIMFWCLNRNLLLPCKPYI